MTFIKKIPIPIGGLILAIISLGNFFISKDSRLIGTILAWISIVFLLSLTVRIFIDFRQIVADMKNPMIAAVAPTFTMSTLSVATFLLQYDALTNFAHILWYAAIVLHVSLMLYFAFRFVFTRQLTINSFYPSWFITFIGIGVITFTSPNFNNLIGTIFFCIALVNYIILLPLILYRVFKTTYDEQPNFPLLTILSAPTSLCLAGYTSIAQEPSIIVVSIALVVSQTLYLVALYFIPNLWKLPFYPSFAAFTFPLAISAIAASLANEILKIPYFNIIITIELCIVSIVTIIVTIRYARFIFKKNK